MSQGVWAQEGTVQLLVPPEKQRDSRRPRGVMETFLCSSSHLKIQLVCSCHDSRLREIRTMVSDDLSGRNAMMSFPLRSADRIFTAALLVGAFNQNYSI